MISDDALVELDRLLEEVDRNARAYGFEVGRGCPLSAQHGQLSDDNPFLNKDWRDALMETP